MRRYFKSGKPGKKRQSEGLTEEEIEMVTLQQELEKLAKDDMTPAERRHLYRRVEVGQCRMTSGAIRGCLGGVWVC